VAEPLAYGLFRAAERSAWHMELRDSYVPDDPDWTGRQGTGSTPPSGAGYVPALRLPSHQAPHAGLAKDRHAGPVRFLGRLRPPGA
jgi:hypothetical protein